jgi:hypothetical protein
MLYQKVLFPSRAEATMRSVASTVEGKVCVMETASGNQLVLGSGNRASAWINLEREAEMVMKALEEAQKEVKEAIAECRAAVTLQPAALNVVIMLGGAMGNVNGNRAPAWGKLEVADSN